MSFSQENGYVPVSIETLMDTVREGINTTFGTSYTSETFVGTGYYKYFYVIIQKLQQNEVKTAEIFVKLQEYFRVTNERISRPVVTNQGLVEVFKNYMSELFPNGILISVKPMIDDDAGKINICVDVDENHEDYADMKSEICEIIKNSTVAGAVTQGTEEETIVLSNGQSFDFKYHLPDRIQVGLRLTITLSENNMSVILPPEDVKSILLLNIQNRYALGKNFEPQKYFSLSDAPWASQILLEWTDDVMDGEIDEMAEWSSDVFDAEFDELFDVDLARVEVVEE